MKKVIVLASVTLVATMFFFGFKNHPVKSKLPPTVNLTLDGYDETTAEQMIDNFKKYCGSDVSLKSVSVFYPIDKIIVMNNLLKAENADPSIKADGVRIYLGSGLPSGSNKKLYVKMMLVSTKSKAPVSPDHLSYHGDYYTHASGVLSPMPVGTITQGNGADVFKKGGKLYGPKEPTDGYCMHPSTHFLPKGVAYAWVQTRYEKGKKDSSPYSIRSEWFRFCFISSFFDALAANNYSGLRIYLGKGPVIDGVAKDVFVLVPTKKSKDKKYDIDNYDCLEDLPGTKLCNDTALLKILKSHDFRIPLDGSGYDKGELCPTICN